jgi:DNA-binding transcriptional ArsR family regulator
MALVRGHHSFDEQFTQIPNSWARDKRLSLKARGVLLLVMSHKPGWHLTIRSLAQQEGISREALSRAIKELEDAGYLERSQPNEGGKFGEAVWTTKDPERPTLPLTDLPLTENQASKNTIYKNTKRLNAQEFEEFWEAYPRKVGKIAAMQAFQKAQQETPAQWIIEGSKRFGTDPNLPEPRFIPYPATWLHRGSWEDGALPTRPLTAEEIVEKSREASRRALEATRREIEEQATWISQPPPKCPHGENVALCKRCL